MRIALIKVHHSRLRPFTYLNVRDSYAYTASEKLACEYMPSLHDANFSLSRDDSRPRNSSCVERISGGRKTHLYRTSGFGEDCSGDQVSQTRSGETASVEYASDERLFLLMDFLRMGDPLSKA